MDANTRGCPKCLIACIGWRLEDDARPNQAQSPHPRRADAACFRQTGRRRLDAAAEFPAVAGSAWSLLGGPSDAAPNVSPADVTVKNGR